MRLRTNDNNISIIPEAYCLLFLLAMIIMMCILQGCGKSDRHQQVAKIVAQIKARPPTPIKALPVIKPLKTVTYQAHGLRDPFLRPQQKKSAQLQRPDLNRTKELLETFPLDGLKMVGTIRQNSKIWALIEAPDGAIHPVAVGNYLGQHFGKITKITSTKTKLTESIQLGGEWQKRTTTLTMKNEK